jgi:uncharacterized protein YjbJ (UPF0337 family)
MSAFEETKGKLKEAAGDLTDDQNLQSEGTAQEQKADAQQGADQARAQARSDETAAQQDEQQERAAQQDK